MAWSHPREIRGKFTISPAFSKRSLPLCITIWFQKIPINVHCEEEKNENSILEKCSASYTKKGWIDLQPMDLCDGFKILLLSYIKNGEEE